ncbi:MAG: hypothetical protein ABIX36_19805 [Mucilaginibacter sp.]
MDKGRKYMDSFPSHKTSIQQKGSIAGTIYILGLFWLRVIRSRLPKPSAHQPGYSRSAEIRFDVFYAKDAKHTGCFRRI